VGNEPSRGDLFIHFTPNQPNTPAPTPTPAAPRRTRAPARREAAAPPPEMTFRLPAAALGRWAPGDTGDGVGPEAQPLALVAGAAEQSSTNGGRPVASAAAPAGRRGARASAAQAAPPVRNGVAARPRQGTSPALPDGMATMPERRETRSGHQDEWLNGMRHGGLPIELTMMIGPPLRGHLVHFDTYSLILDTGAGTVLVFKHAVATVRALPAPAAAEETPRVRSRAE